VGDAEEAIVLEAGKTEAKVKVKLPMSDE
jgi:hypothetical protein